MATKKSQGKERRAKEPAPLVQQATQMPPAAKQGGKPMPVASFAPLNTMVGMFVAEVHTSPSLAQAGQSAGERAAALDALKLRMEQLNQGVRGAIDGLRGDAEAKARQLQDLVDQASAVVHAAEQIAPIAAAWANYLLNTVGPASLYLARWAYDGNSSTNPFTAADDEVVKPASAIYANTSGAARTTLDNILAGVETCKKNANDLVAKKDKWDKDGNFNGPGDTFKKAYLAAQAALMSLPG